MVVEAVLAKVPQETAPVGITDDFSLPYLPDALFDPVSKIELRAAVNELKPLPLFDAGFTLLGLTNGAGHLVIEESVAMKTQPDWVGSSPAGSNPASWVGAWQS